MKNNKKQTPSSKQRNNIVITCVVAISLVGTTWFFYPTRIRSQSEQSIEQQEPWVTVFVHGTFGSLLGFLNLFDVWSDATKGTLYRSTVKKTRDDEAFFSDCIMTPRGFMRITPTWERQSVEKKYGAYPLVQAYWDVQEAVSPGSQVNYFYAFGWSGLLSQKDRMVEAVRLFNALCEELETLAHNGIVPKIRIICHSHGGNVALNLAPINLVLASNWHEKQIAKDLNIQPAACTTVEKLATYFSSLTTKELAKQRTGQKNLDYIPTHKNLVIDELIMLGTPFQPETSSFAFLPTFKKVISIYSTNDRVQRADWVSSRYPLSSQRLPAMQSKDIQAPLVQEVRIMMEAPIVNNSIKIPGKVLDGTEQQSNVWAELLSGTNIFENIGKDPTHKDFWFLNLDKKESDKSFLGDLPIVIIIPLLLNVLDKTPTCNDCDITCNINQTHVTAALAAHTDTNKMVKSIAQCPRAVIDQAKEKAQIWKPEKDMDPRSLFERTYKHLSTASTK